MLQFMPLHDPETQICAFQLHQGCSTKHSISFKIEMPNKSSMPGFCVRITCTRKNKQWTMRQSNSLYRWNPFFIIFTSVNRKLLTLPIVLYVRQIWSTLNRIISDRMPLVIVHLMQNFSEKKDGKPSRSRWWCWYIMWEVIVTVSFYGKW